MGKLEIKELTKIFKTGKYAVKDFNLEVEDGECVVFVGPSGCGKTTTLRMIAGLEKPTNGEIILNGENITNKAVKERDIAMIFQNYALYENMTSQENIEFPLKMRKTPKEEAHKKAKEVAEKLGIIEILDRYPKTLSGGERQRVAMARAIVRDPIVYLMDEPLSNLDAKLRIKIREEISHMRQDFGGTIIYVTHDQNEAMTLADRIVVMNEGEIVQIGTPKEIYERPNSEFVAGFFGNIPINFFERNGRLFAVRPENIEVSDFKKDGWQKATLVKEELLGPTKIIYLRIDQKEILANVPSSFEAYGKEIYFYIKEKNIIEL